MKKIQPILLDDELCGEVVFPPFTSELYKEDFENPIYYQDNLDIKPEIESGTVIDLKSFPVDIKFKDNPPNADLKDCIKTSEFKYMNFPFRYFNPIQSLFFKELDNDKNIIICSSTSSGKTTIAEMVISQTLSEIRKKSPEAKSAYIAPLKALCKEKEEDWTDISHPFSKCKISIITGDYILTEERKKELSEADIIAMSSEMLGSRIRRNESEKNTFLMDIKTCVFDESHLITVPERGPNLESALMKFTKVNPSCRIVFLSATMPNVDELGNWLTKLNGKETTILKSDYRPVDLKWNWEVYDGDNPYSYKYNYFHTEKEKRKCAINTILKYSNDKFLLFVHAKRQGRKLQEELDKSGVKTEFYNADLKREERDKMFLAFKNRKKGSLRVLISTSSLAWGINVPARRVFISGIHRGKQEVLPLDIIQMGGRAGRVGLDVKGDVHVAINKSQAIKEIDHCKNVPDIESQINNMKILAFHLISEINEKNIKTFNDAIKWFERTLSHHQNIMGTTDKAESLIKSALRELEIIQAISVVNRNGNDVYQIKPVGKVSSWFYMSPFDVASWRNNFYKVLKESKPTKIELAYALANTDTNKKDYGIRETIIGDMISEKDFDILMEKGYGFIQKEGGILKHLVAIHHLMTNKKPKTPEINGVMSRYRMDMDRILAAIKVLNSTGKYFDKLEGSYRLYELEYMVKYGISSKAIELVMLPDIGYVRAKALMDSYKIYTAKDLVTQIRMGRKPLKENKIAKILPVAEEIARIGHIEYLKKINRRKYR